MDSIFNKNSHVLKDVSNVPISESLECNTYIPKSNQNTYGNIGLKDGKSCPGSILKRLSRNYGKENEDNLNVFPCVSEAKSPLPKRVRIVLPNNDDDDDFQTPAKRLPTFQTPKEISLLETDIVKEHKNENLRNEGIIVLHDSDTGNKKTKPRRNRRRNKKEFEHWLLTRIQPKILSDTILSLSNQQRIWVKKTGFGCLLSFKMNEYPHALSYYLALSFQSQPTSLNFGKNRIPISDDDVNEVLGLPKGTESVPFIKSTHTFNIWRSQFPSAIEGWKITANMVCDAIKQSSDVDRTFKLNFLVLMSNILLEGPTNPYVRQTMLGFSGDLDNCGKYNWCQYLLNHLEIASLPWLENPDTKYYTGSVPFIVFFYMDRVVDGKRDVRRKKPTFIGWSDNLILDRQATDIGQRKMFQGRIALPLRYKDSDDESSFEDYTWNKIDDDFSEEDEVEGTYVNPLCNMQKKDGNVCQNDNHNTINCGNQDPSDCNNKSETDEIFESYSKLETQVPQYEIEKLKDSLREYEQIQKNCLMYLLSAKKSFPDNVYVSSLESKFCDLVQEAKQILDNNAPQRLFDEPVAPSQFSNFEICESTSKVCQSNVMANKLNSLEDDLILTEEDLDMIDKCSIRHNEPTAMDVYKSMESQSKTHSLINGSKSIEFKTPSNVSVFKVNLESSIPSFDLGVADTPIPVVRNEDVVNVNADERNLQTRPRREVKPAEVCRSPFYDRVTNITGKGYKKEELDLWNWLHADNENPNRVVFKWNTITCYMAEFQSMKVGERILSATVDVWSCFLNSLEDLRSTDSVRRLFCFTETTAGTLNSFDESTVMRKYQLFEDNLLHILKTFSVVMNDVDLVFFPIHHQNHYYVVCYNLKYPAFEILDNMSSDSSIEELYGNQIFVLHQHFSKFMEIHKVKRAIDIAKLRPNRLKMYWQTKKNMIDCGIFAMRHMETYFGGGIQTWESYFAVESYTQGRQLIRARILFCVRMLSANLNSVYDIISDIIKYSRGRNKSLKSKIG